LSDNRTPDIVLQDALRHNINAIDASEVVPLERWDLMQQEASLGTAPIRFSFFIENVACFDLLAFSLSESEAILIDPQQRVLLECVGEAIAASGLEQSATRTSGVFVVRA